MNQFQDDLFDLFINQYEQGNPLQAFQLILTSPEIEYDRLTSTQKIFPYLVNYVDASIFKSPAEAYIANRTLHQLLSSDKRLAVIYGRFLEILQEESLLMAFFMTNTKEEIQNALSAAPSHYQVFIEEKLKLLQFWDSFKHAKPELSVVIERQQKMELLQPWQIFSYSIITPIPELAEKGRTPVIFLEPTAHFDYEPFLANLSGQEALFIFESIQTFMQMLQFPAVKQALIESTHLTYILSLYPASQLDAQGASKIQFQPLQPIMGVKRQVIQETMPLFLNLLQRSLHQSQEELERETPLSNWLYRVSKRILFNIQEQRYGESRCLALNIAQSYDEWFDPHKGLPPVEANLGTPSKDYFGKKISQLESQRQARSFSPHHKVRLAHVVPQIVDRGHAPTRLLKNLICYSDKAWFDILLISSERLTDHPLDYPTALYASESSNQRGMGTLKFLWEHRKINIVINDSEMTYEQSAYHIAQILENQAIDIVIFHGPDEINTLCSAVTNVPMRVLFDHGSLPHYFCFDLAILSTEEAFRKHRQEYRQMGMESCPLEFSIDVREGWLPLPFKKEELGLLSGSFVMTTISNHLDNRLSLEMCQAIGEILQDCPNAYYAPMGQVKHPERFYSIFDEYGVSSRVIFLGSKGNPSQCARSMELYLNEFPFGSGLGMLDAMAAGCPVVSMYDEQGPQQARYGEIYFGTDWVIKSGKKEEYVKLACQLIKDPKLYQAWSEHAKVMYNKRSDVRQYVKTFEKILEKFIDYKEEKEP